MKSTDVPKFEQQWWKKNKGLLVPETGFGKLLGAFEVVEDQMDYAKQLKALDDISKALPNVVKAAAKDKDTVTVLNKYPNLITQKKGEIVKKQNEEKARAAAANKPSSPPPQKMGPLEKLWGRDFGEVVGHRLPWLQMKGYMVELKVNSDVLDILHKQDGGATAALMIKDAQELCEKYAVEYIKSAEGLAGDRKTPMTELQKRAQTMFQAIHPKLIAEIKEIPKRRWEKFKNDKPMWREYKIETGANIAIGSLQIVVGAASIAAAVPTMGATLPLAVVTTARGLYKTVTEVVNLVRSVESDQKELVVSMQSLSKAYLDEKQKATIRAQAQEIGAAVLKGILGAHPPFVQSLDKCNTIYHRWEPKVASLRIDHGKTLKEVQDLMADAGKLEAEMAKSKTDQAVKLMGKVKKIREGVTKSLDLVHDLGGRITKAEQAEPKLKEGMEELNNANPNYVKVFTVLFPAAVSIGLAAGSGGVELAHAESALEIAKATMVLSEEILDTVKEVAAHA